MTQFRPAQQPEIVGRNAERDLIAKLTAGARSGRSATLLIEGEPGIGKTTLLGSVRSVLPAFRIITLKSEHRELYLAGNALARLERALAVQGAGRGRPFERGLRLADALVSLQQRHPVALMIDDLHWCDAESRAAVGVMLRRLPKRARLLVLMTFRPGANSTSEDGVLVKADLIRSHVVRLEGLSRDQVADLVRMNGVSLHLRHVEDLHRRTRGNPRHVLALLEEARDLVCTGHLRLAAPWQLVQETAAELDRMPQDTRRVTEALSVLDRRSPLCVVAAVSDVEHVADVVEPAVTSGLVLRDTSAVVERLEIVDPLVAAAVYRTMERDARRGMHRRAAALCSGRARLEHQAAAADAADDALATELAEFAKHCGQARRHGLAAKYLSWSARLSTEVSTRETRFLESCYQHLLDRNLPAVLVGLDRLRSLRGSPRRDLVLGVLARAQGRISDAVDLLAAAQSTVDRAGEPELFAQLTSELGWALYLVGAPGEVLLRTVAPLAEHAGNDQAVQETVSCLITIARGLHAVAMSDGGGAAHEPRTEAKPAFAETLIMRASVRWWVFGERRRSLLDLDEAFARLKRGESTRLMGAGYGLGAAMMWFGGDWARAESYAARARHVSAIDEQAAAYAWSSLVPSGRGDWQAARAHLEAALAAIRRLPNPDAAAVWSFCLITYCHAADDLAVLRRYIDSHLMMQAIRRIGDERTQGWLLFEFVRALLLAGQVFRAENLVQTMAPDPRRAPWTSMGAWWVRGLVAQHTGELDRAKAAFEKALRIAEHHGSAAPLHHAHLLAEYGTLLYDHDAAARGEELVRAAHRIYERLGARPFAERTKRLLVPHGCAVPEQGERAVTISLTDKERAIVLLVSKGLTNKDIGRRLLVTDKTVEFHLSNIYAKCWIRGRRQLRELAETLLDGGDVEHRQYTAS